jgi:hypothetical protein
MTWCTGPMLISIIASSKTTVASNSATTLCAGMARFTSASRFCRAFEEVRQFFRFRTTMKQHVSLADRRRLFHQQLDALKAMVLVA